MATLTPLDTSAALSTATPYTAASTADTIPISGAPKAVLKVNNTGAAITVNLAGISECSCAWLHDVHVTCPTGDTEIPIPYYCVSGAGLVGVTYSRTTGVTVAVVTYPSRKAAWQVPRPVPVGTLTLADNGDGSYAISGSGVTDNGDGTLTINDPALTVPGDGTYLITV